MYAVVVWYPSGIDCRLDSITHRVPGPSVRGTAFNDQSFAVADPPSAMRARTAVRTRLTPETRGLPSVDIRADPFA
jgi:hypothetical protein